MLRLDLTLAWLAALLAFFRWWDLTYLVPALPGWALGFLAAFLLTAMALQRAARLARAEVWRAATWGAFIALTVVGNLLLPTVRIGDAMVHTVAFVKVVDTVVPVWIVVRALILLWTGVRSALALTGAAAILAVGGWLFVIAMPGRSAPAALAPLTPRQDSLRVALAADVRALAGLGERSVRMMPALDSAAAWIARRLAARGFAVERQPFGMAGRTVENLVVELPGTTAPDRVVGIGAHYDTAEGAPGADDNASGVATLVALAERFAGRPQSLTLRFVAFTTEEPPYFNTARMGSRVYAEAAARRGERLAAMVALETVGYFADEPRSQRYPPPFAWFYPDRFDFIAFVGNLESRPLVRRAIARFRAVAGLPSEGAAMPALIPGVSWSDHASFWRHGWRAIMITDTAPFRNPHYHLRSDTPDRLDYARMARLVEGLEAVVADLAAR